MENVATWVTVISILFAVAGLLSSVFAVIRSQLIKVRIESLEGLVDTQEIEIQGLERKNTAQEADIKSVHAELDAEKRKVAALQDLKTARAEIIALTTLLTNTAGKNDTDHEEIVLHLVAIEKALGAKEATK